jgi:hypothetical protein
MSFILRTKSAFLREIPPLNLLHPGQKYPFDLIEKFWLSWRIFFVKLCRQLLPHCSGFEQVPFHRKPRSRFEAVLMRHHSKLPAALFMATLSSAALLFPTQANAQTTAPGDTSSIVIEAEKPTRQQGSQKRDLKAGASGGEVLGEDFGTAYGNFAEYKFRLEAPRGPLRIEVHYARSIPGNALLDVTLDGTKLGTLSCGPTGGWGDEAGQFRQVEVRVPALAAGEHVLVLTVVAGAALATAEEKKLRPRAVPVLELVGNRADKNSMGHGKNVALYTGAPSRFFYATHELGNVFSAADGKTINWSPDYVSVTPQAAPGNINLDRIVIAGGPGAVALPVGMTSDNLVEVRQVCVTKDDVTVSRLHFKNTSAQPITRRIEITGDCRGSFDWRGRPGGEKITRRDGNGVLMFDKNVFPEVLPDGLAMVIGGTTAPVEADVSTPGTYRLTYEVQVPAGGERDLMLACAIDRSADSARANLAKTLAQPDPIAVNRAEWERFYKNDVPQFESSDSKLNELYAFRWFLLKFSTAGGDLGLFKYPVVMEGRQAFQTYCCYSAPFVAFDMNWAIDPKVGLGHIANMKTVAYENGSFPWYASPRTNDVPLEHPSKSGMSLLPHTLWQWYQIHGDKTALRNLYATMKKNQQWWIADRDPDGNGLFSIDHQLETGMDDLHRRWKTGKPKRYEAVDATSYEILNLQAVANMARELGEKADATYFEAYAKKSSAALQNVSWDKSLELFRDRNPDTGELADYNSICVFYPMMTDAMKKEQMKEARRYLLNPKEYWTPHPLPAVSQSDPEFDPVKRYWAGPSWPAATSHIIEGFASSAKKLDRSLLPDAAELFKRAAANHTAPRPDFYERYDPFTGKGLSNFRDYMHSWWIDIYIRHVAGFEPQDNGSVVIDPLPMKLDWFALRNTPHRGHRADVEMKSSGPDAGLTVRIDGKAVRREKKFRPGIDRLTLPASLFR